VNYLNKLFSTENPSETIAYWQMIKEKTNTIYFPNTVDPGEEIANLPEFLSSIKFYVNLERFDFDPSSMEADEQIGGIEFHLMESDEKKDNLHIIDGRFYIFFRLKEMLCYKFRSDFLGYLLKWFGSGTKGKPVCISDVKNIGVRVKHMNIVEQAQGYIYREEGLKALETDIETSKRYFLQALDKFTAGLVFLVLIPIFYSFF